MRRVPHTPLRPRLKTHSRPFSQQPPHHLNRHTLFFPKQDHNPPTKNLLGCTPQKKTSQRTHRTCIHESILNTHFPSYLLRKIGHTADGRRLQQQNQVKQTVGQTRSTSPYPQIPALRSAKNSPHPDPPPCPCRNCALFPDNKASRNTQTAPRTRTRTRAPANFLVTNPVHTPTRKARDT